jgi:hypothetical protein
MHGDFGHSDNESLDTWLDRFMGNNLRHDCGDGADDLCGFPLCRKRDLLCEAPV